MFVEDAAIDGVKIITPRVHRDARGYFVEVYNEADWRAADLHLTFVQDNHSFSAQAGVLRGLHFQTAPCMQAKLVRVIRGRIFDVAVDIRRSSPTFGMHVAVELSGDNWRQMLIPIGFAHGFLTLEPETEVLYKTTASYSVAHDFGLAWNDPDLGIDWPAPAGGPLMSERDGNWPRLRELARAFE